MLDPDCSSQAQEEPKTSDAPPHKTSRKSDSDDQEEEEEEEEETVTAHPLVATVPTSTEEPQQQSAPFSHLALSHDLEVHRRQLDSFVRARSASQKSGGEGSSASLDSEEDAWVMRRYRNEMIKDIMGTSKGQISPAGSMHSATSGLDKSATPSVRSHLPSRCSDTPSAVAPQAEAIRRSLLFTEAHDPTSSNWSSAIELLARLSKDQIDLCRRVEMSLREEASKKGDAEAASPGQQEEEQQQQQHASSFFTYVSPSWLLNPSQTEQQLHAMDPMGLAHYNPLERLQILRAVKCKKTFERARDACVAFSMLIDRFGLTLLTAEDLARVTARKALCYLDPRVCTSRDGCGIFYIVADRIDFHADPSPLVQAALFEIERGIAIMPSLDQTVVIVDASRVKLTELARNSTVYLNFIVDAVKGKYMLRIRYIVVLGVQGIVDPMIVRAFAVTRFGWKLQQRTSTIMTLRPYVDLVRLRRALTLAGLDDVPVE